MDPQTRYSRRLEFSVNPPGNVRARRTPRLRTSTVVRRFVPFVGLALNVGTGAPRVRRECDKTRRATAREPVRKRRERDAEPLHRDRLG